MNRMLPATMVQRLRKVVNNLPAINSNQNGGFVPDCATGHVGECAKTEIET
jgi:hypothetical protein